MLNFNFYNPTRIIFGGDTIAKINDYVPTEAKVLMLFGGESARKNGTLAEVREALGAREIHEFGGIEPNPSYETLMKAVELIREQKIDFLMAVGGAINGLMNEMLEVHLKDTLVSGETTEQQRKEELAEIAKILKSYLK